MKTNSALKWNNISYVNITCFAGIHKKIKEIGNAEKS